jgi:hypothetical protein
MSAPLARRLEGRSSARKEELVACAVPHPHLPSWSTTWRYDPHGVLGGYQLPNVDVDGSVSPPIGWRGWGLAGIGAGTGALLPRYAGGDGG